ncbi:hypothetical protein D3C72_1712600 [compost metagenome]
MEWGGGPRSGGGGDAALNHRPAPLAQRTVETRLRPRHRLIDARHLLLQQRIGRRLLLDLVQTGVIRPFERLERRHHLMQGGARLGRCRGGLGLFHIVSS